MKEDKQVTREELLKQMKVLKRTNPIYPNQKYTAARIVNKLEDPKVVNILTLGRTQSGKTGTIFSLISKYVKFNPIDINNIFIITGLASIEWKAQTRERMPQLLHKNIFHRTDLIDKFVPLVKNLTNVLIIMDEVQIAAKQDQTINTVFTNAGFTSLGQLLKRRLRFVEFTATPNNITNELLTWGQHFAIVVFKPAEGYIGSNDMLKMKNLKQYKELYPLHSSRKQVIENIKELMADVKSYKRPMYHIIRIHTTDENMILLFSQFAPKVNFIVYDQGSNFDINDVLGKPPTQHTFILVKEMLRVAKTIIKKYLGVSYERWTPKPNDTVIIQGLLGRNCGYDFNKHSIIYTNLDTVKRYEKMWNQKFITDEEKNDTFFNKVKK